MRKRRNAEETARLLRDADRDLAKGLTVADFCRKVGVAETTYYRWRRRNDPNEVDSERRCRELERRDEFMERHEFETVANARAKGSSFRREYNRIRPHGSPAYKTPEEFGKLCDAEKIAKDISA